MIDDKKKEKLTSNSKKNVVQIDDIEQLKSEYAKSLEVFSYLLIHTPGIINEAIFRGLESKVNDLKEVYSETISNIKKEAEIRKANAEKRREEKAQKAKEIKAKKVEEAEIRRANAEKRREEKVQKAKEIKTKKEEKAEAKRINRSRAISDAKKNSQRTAFDIEYAKTIRQKEQKEWEDKYEGRNEYVKSGVRIINNTIGINALTMQAKGIAFLAGLASKGAALIGLRKLSNRIAEKGGEFALSKLRCTTIAGRYSMKIAEKGFKISDKLNDIKETRAEIKEGKAQIRKDKLEKRKEKIEIGKGKYKAGDYAKAMGQVVLEGASKRIEKLQSGANKLAEDTGMVQSARKVSLIGIRAKIGFKGFIKNAAQGVVDKLNDSLLNDEMKKTKLELKTQENSSRFSNEIVPEL